MGWGLGEGCRTKHSTEKRLKRERSAQVHRDKEDIENSNTQRSRKGGEKNENLKCTIKMKSFTQNQEQR
jgi:hypothetical protein